MRLSVVAPDRGLPEFKEYDVLLSESLKDYRKVENKENLPWSVYVGVCGMPGAYAPLCLLLLTESATSHRPNSLLRVLRTFQASHQEGNA